jgi:transcriptional regulator
MGHMAYGNPQWRKFETCEDVLVIFQGPHAYISSSWYEEENVPAWNYQAVHVYGTASILDEEELKQDLTMLLQKYEKHRKNPVLWDKLSPQLLEQQLKGIVGFKINIMLPKGETRNLKSKLYYDYEKENELHCRI